MKRATAVRHSFVQRFPGDEETDPYRMTVTILLHESIRNPVRVIHIYNLGAINDSYGRVMVSIDAQMRGTILYKMSKTIADIANLEPLPPGRSDMLPYPVRHSDDPEGIARSKVTEMMKIAQGLIHDELEEARAQTLEIPESGTILLESAKLALDRKIR